MPVRLMLAEPARGCSGVGSPSQGRWRRCDRPLLQSHPHVRDRSRPLRMHLHTYLHSRTAQHCRQRCIRPVKAGDARCALTWSEPKSLRHFRPDFRPSEQVVGLQLERRFPEWMWNESGRGKVEVLGCDSGCIPTMFVVLPAVYLRSIIGSVRNTQPCPSKLCLPP